VAEAKTNPTDNSVSDYIAAIPDAGRRSDCEALVKLMTRITKKKPVMWGSSIVGFDAYHYKYASGREGDSCLLGFSSRKTDLTIYVTSGFEGTEAILSELGKYETARSCLYVKKLSDIDPAALEALLRHAAAAMKRRYP
jgi:hypothetical protein